MEIRLRTLDVPLTAALERYIRARLAKLDRIHARVADARFDLRSERQRSGGEQFVAQFTITTSSAILRAEHRHRDIHQAIDGAIDHMASQIRRFRKKQILNRRRSRASGQADGTAQHEATVKDLTVPAVEEDETPPAVVRRKRFTVYPMSEEEAIEQMELLGHDFFVFFNPSDDQINVLYRRKDGHYGLIQPVLG
ncbi:Ribosome hibernation promotion factor [bacterium HR26]|nr:Ribosome hibernation promotion factor [bacterium HR26]